MDQEAPPPRNGDPIDLDDDSDDALEGGRNKGRPDERIQVKLEVKRRGEQERLTSKIEEMMNVKQRISQEQLQTRKELTKSKHREKIRKCEVIQEDEKRKVPFEDRRIRLEEETEENCVMMMDPTLSQKNGGRLEG
jgi:hypothetical protein